jgi:hypothetical protein
MFRLKKSNTLAETDVPDAKIGECEENLKKDFGRDLKRSHFLNV